MSTIYCDVERITLPGEYSDQIPSTRATCPRCDHATESYGVSQRSVYRCLLLMRVECPIGERNFYEES